MISPTIRETGGLPDRVWIGAPASACMGRSFGPRHSCAISWGLSCGPRESRTQLSREEGHGHDHYQGDEEDEQQVLNDSGALVGDGNRRPTNSRTWTSRWVRIANIDCSPMVRC